MSFARYAPLGRRGVALTCGQDRYTVGPVREKLDAANRRTVGTPSEGAALFAPGFDFICLSTDTQIYLEALRTGLGELGEQATPPPAAA